jgi:hypothetical protein
MIVYIGTDGKVYAFTAAAERAKSDATITDGAWNHIAVVRSSGTLNVYVGGLGGTGASYASAITCPGVLRFGVDSTGGAGFIGYMDEIRVTPGVARYTADFTPPDAAFGDYDRYLAGAITEATDHTDFVVRAHRLDTGALITELASTGGAYEIPMMISGVGYTGPVMLSAWPRLGSLWAANTAKSLGDYAFPVDPVTTPHVFKCTTAGTTHSTTEPTWDTTPGNTTSDGSVTWTCVDRMLQPLIQGPLIPSI